MGAHLRAEPVLERGDDPAAVGVVLGVGAGHQQQVQRQPHPVAADLDVALLEHVEQRHLDPLGQVGQLVDAEDAAVGARDQAVVDGLRVTQRAALGHLDRVDVADQVADAGVRGGQLLAEPVAAVQPADRGGVAVLGDLPAPPDADRLQRVLVELAADQHRRPLVEQADQGADEPGLALAALAEQDQVVPGDERALDLGDDGVLEPDDAGQRGLAGGQPGEQVVADLGLDRPGGGAAGAELAQRCRPGSGGMGDCEVPSGAASVTSTTVRRRCDGRVFRRPASIRGLRRSAGVRPRSSPPGQRCRRRGGRRAAGRRRAPHPARALPRARRPGRRPRLAQVREPAAHRLVQDPRRVHPDRPADRPRSGPRGVVAASAGNHAQGVALAARELGAAATVFMPESRAAAQGRRHPRLRRRRAAGRGRR